MRLEDMLSWVCTNPMGKHLPGEDWIIRRASEERGTTLVIEVFDRAPTSTCYGRAGIADPAKRERILRAVREKAGQQLREVASLEV